MKKNNLFNFYKAIDEALDFRGNPNLMSADKQADFEAGRIDTMGMLPQDPTALDYYHLLVSDNYEKCLNRLVHYTGTPANQLGTYPFMRAVLNAIQTIQQIESQHKRFFENLALQCVLELDEYQVVKELLEDQKIIFDVRLDYGDLGNAITDAQKAQEQEESNEEKVENDNKLTPNEKANMKIAMEFMGDDEIKMRKAFANALTQGDALDKMYLFNIVSERLNEINPQLINQYGIASSIVQFLYYMMPKGIEGGAAGNAMGSEEVSDTGDGIYKIKARGVIFPFLVHEIIKGINDYLNYTPETRYEKRTLEDETKDINYGQALVSRILRLIPTDKMKYRFSIQQRLLEMEVDELKEILKGGTQAQQKINEIISEIEGEHGENQEEDEPYKDSE
jgi:hypothetical protein